MAEQAFPQETISGCEKGVLLNGVCWAKSNVDKPGTFVTTVAKPEYFVQVPELYGMLYQWNSEKGWIATNPFSEGDTIIAVGNPCPAGWRIPTIDEVNLKWCKSCHKIESSYIFYYWNDNIKPVDSLLIPVFGRNIDESKAIPKCGYWSSSGDKDDASKAWMFLPTQSGWDIRRFLVPRDYAFYIRCVKEKCDTIVTDTFVTIFTDDLPYKWRDTVFQVGTKTGTYHFKQSNCAYTEIIDLHLTVQKCTTVTNISETICVKDLPYQWCDTTFDIGTVSGTYSFRYESAATGYDSIVNLCLTVHHPSETVFYDTVCQGDAYDRHGFSLPDVYADTTVSDTLQTAWGCDSIRTLRLTVHPVYNQTLHATICEGDGYDGYGFHFPEGTSGGTYTQTRNLQTIHGCDSTVTLHLTVLPKYFFTESRDICRGEFAEFQGRRYYESGTYYDSLKTVAGCDSICRLVLNVHPVFDLYFTGDVCYGEPYNDYGFSLPAVYADTTVSDTLQTAWGCDSIRTLHLTVHPVYDTPLRDTVCQGDDYRNHGFSLSDVQTGGEHSLTLPSRFGCDSVLHLQLAVQPSYSLTLYDSICPSGRYDGNGFRLSDVTASGTHILRLKTVAGCDSIVTLNLHVYRDYLFAETKNACEGDTVNFRGRWLYESGTYDDALKTVHGCDSIYRLVLDVHPVYAVSLKDVFCEGIPYTRYGFHVAEPGIHILRLKTIHGCDSTVTLALSEEKKVRGGIGLSLEDCETHGYAFFFEPDSAKGNWQWDMGDGTTYRTQEGYHAYADSGTYRVTLQLETLNGCRNEYAREQWVPHYAREVAIRANRTVIDAETPAVQFRAEAPAGTVCRWEFGDGDTAEGTETEHVYDAATARYYDVVLRVFNADSCVTEAAARIEVLPLPKEVNTFSPNGDGINDVFMPEFRVEIFNRNGHRIYVGEHGWDGTCRTGNAAEDTYFYKLYYRTATGDRVKTGYVVLVR